MNDYEANRRWSDLYLPQVKSLVGPHLLDVASFEVDTEEAADLTVLRVSDKRIGVRMRRLEEVKEDWLWQFAIRSKNKFGGLTEFNKVFRGFGDWLFYGFSPSGPVVAVERWFIVRYDSLRYHYSFNRGALWRQEKPNWDGTGLTAFGVHSFPVDPPILLDCSHPQELNQDNPLHIKWVAELEEADKNAPQKVEYAANQPH